MFKIENGVAHHKKLMSDTMFSGPLKTQEVKHVSTITQ